MLELEGIGVKVRAIVLPALIVLGVAAAAGPAKTGKTVQVRYPDPDIGVDSLAARAKAQRATVDQFKVFYEFQFQDKVKESGITFRHRIVDDAGLHYKAVHYDHGNGDRGGRRGWRRACRTSTF